MKCVLYKFSCPIVSLSKKKKIIRKNKCVSEGNDCEHRKVIMDFVNWCELNHLQINASKTKEMAIDFSRKPSSNIAPVNIQGLHIQIVRKNKYLGVHLNNKTELDRQHRLVLLERSESTLHAEETGILWCEQVTTNDLL